MRAATDLYLTTINLIKWCVPRPAERFLSGLTNEDRDDLGLQLNQNVDFLSDKLSWSGSLPRLYHHTNRGVNQQNCLVLVATLKKVSHI